MKPNDSLPANGSAPSAYFRFVRTTATLGLLATSVMFFASHVWIADLVAQFKIQCAIALLVIAGLSALSRRWRWTAACLIGVVMNTIPIFPYVIDTGRGGSNSSGAQSLKKKSAIWQRAVAWGCYLCCEDICGCRVAHEM